VDVLRSRILLRPSDLDRSRRSYRDLLGLAIYREFGPPDDPGLVFFLGPLSVHAVRHGGVRSVQHVDELCVTAAGRPADAAATAGGLQVTMTEIPLTRPPARRW
jgi:hypothetical protein